MKSEPGLETMEFTFCCYATLTTDDNFNVSNSDKYICNELKFNPFIPDAHYIVSVEAN